MGRCNKMWVLFLRVRYLLQWRLKPDGARTHNVHMNIQHARKTTLHSNRSSSSSRRASLPKCKILYQVLRQLRYHHRHLLPLRLYEYGGTTEDSVCTSSMVQQPSPSVPQVPVQQPSPSVPQVPVQQLSPIVPQAQGQLRVRGVPQGHDSQLQQHVESQGMTAQVITTSPPEDFPQRPEQGANKAVWMMRLGEFFQKRVSQAAAVVAPVLERPVRTSMRPAPTPPTSWASPQVEAPLFGQEAEQMMQQWPHRAPLLYGMGAQASVAPRETASSTGSLTQEQVLAEVHRQVQRAMDGHQQELRALEDENKRLRSELLRKESEAQQPTLLPDLRGGDLREHPGGGVLSGALRGEATRGPPQGPPMSEVNRGEASEGVEIAGPPPGLEAQSRAGIPDGDRGPFELRGGDPAMVVKGKKVWAERP